MNTGIASLYGGAEALGSMSDEQVAAILQGPPGQIPQFMAMAELGRRERSTTMAGGGPPPAEPTVKDELLARMSQSNMAPGGLKDMAGAMRAPQPQAPPTTYAADGMFPARPSISGVLTLDEIMELGSQKVEPKRPWWKMFSYDPSRAIWNAGIDMTDGNPIDYSVPDTLTDEAKAARAIAAAEVSNAPELRDMSPAERIAYVDRLGNITGDEIDDAGSYPLRLPLPPMEGPPMPADYFDADEETVTVDPEVEPGPGTDTVVGPFAGAEKEKYNDWLALAAGGARLASGNPNDFGPAISEGIAALIDGRARVDEKNYKEQKLAMEQQKLDIAMAAATAKGAYDPALGPVFDRIGTLEQALAGYAGGPELSRIGRAEAEKELQNLKDAVNRALQIAPADGGGGTVVGEIGDGRAA
jgi:hypothetical protein